MGSHICSDCGGTYVAAPGVYEQHVRENFHRRAVDRKNGATFNVVAAAEGRDPWAITGHKPARRGDWMQTFTGGRYYPTDPHPDDIKPEDIAHALSMLCRYGGHVDRFYSVAEHCVLMSQAVEPERALAALLHDATEAYVVDVPRPLKRYLPEYRFMEAMAWSAIAERFDVDIELPPEVKLADNRILLTERNALMPRAERWTWDDEVEPLPVDVEGWSPVVAEKRYLLRLRELLA